MDNSIISEIQLVIDLIQKYNQKEFHCALCSIDHMKAKPYIIHLLSNEHKRSCRFDEDENLYSNPFYCKTCCILSKHKKAFEKHLKTKKHVTNFQIENPSIENKNQTI